MGGRAEGGREKVNGKSGKEKGTEKGKGEKEKL